MSTTGTRPVTAAPKAEPTMAASEIGAFSTRSGPNSSIRPFVTPNGRPRTMSSPMQYTRRSRRISSRSARFSASPKSSFILIGPRIVREEVVERVFAARQRAGLGVRDGAHDRVPHGDDVVAVDALAGNTVAGGARGDAAARRRARVRGGRRPPIVLADEHDRQRPERGEIHALVKRSTVRCAVAEERDDDLTGSALLDRQPDAGRDDAARCEHAVGAEIADGDVGDVHRAALAVTDPVGLAV